MLIHITDEISNCVAHHGLVLAPGALVSLPFTFETPVRLWSKVELYGVTMGAYSYASPLSVLADIRIGRYCSIGDGVRILSQHPKDWLTAHPFAYEHIFPPPYHNPATAHFPNLLPTVIGDDVWVGSGVRIRCGVTIGNGAIIGSGAIVTKDVPPFAVMAGVPARVIRFRFAEDLIERINACPWWAMDLTSVPINWQQPYDAQGQLEDAVTEGRVQRWTPGWQQLVWGTTDETETAAPGQQPGAIRVRALAEHELPVD